MKTEVGDQHETRTRRRRVNLSNKSMEHRAQSEGRRRRVRAGSPHKCLKCLKLKISKKTTDTRERRVALDRKKQKLNRLIPPSNTL